MPIIHHKYFQDAIYNYVKGKNFIIISFPRMIKMLYIYCYYIFFVLYISTYIKSYDICFQLKSILRILFAVWTPINSFQCNVLIQNLHYLFSVHLESTIYLFWQSVLSCANNFYCRWWENYVSKFTEQKKSKAYKYKNYFFCLEFQFSRHDRITILTYALINMIHVGN